MIDIDGRDQNGLNEQGTAEQSILDAYARGDAGDRLALFLSYRDMRRAFKAVDLGGSGQAEPGKRRLRCCRRLGRLLG